MEILEILKSDKPFSINDRKIPNEYKQKAKELCFKYNNLAPSQKEEKQTILKELFGDCSDLTFIEPIFYCDYGFNIHTSGLTVINHNCTFLDTSPIYIGKNVFIAPNVVISCAGHSKDAIQRAEGIMTSAPIRIGDDVWIGANATIIAGVTIGNGSIIGAGSIVTKDIPANVIATGVPCKVLREVKESDRENIIEI